MPEHHREADGYIPSRIKWIMTFINRVGFPIVAFGVVSYLCFATIKEQGKAILELKEVFISMKGSIDKNSDSVIRMTEAIYRSTRQRNNQ